MQSVVRVYSRTVSWLNLLGAFISLLMLRLLLAWEYGESGYTKWVGENWFANLQFPFAFNLLLPYVSWWMATGFELAGAVALLFGLATRFFSLSLIILTIVAILSAHWPEQWNSLRELLTGYRIIDENDDEYGNYKLPLIFLMMFLPLMFNGAGRVSLDYLIRRNLERQG